jgi:predicted ArsR family transcriptional regulator
VPERLVAPLSARSPAGPTRAPRRAELLGVLQQQGTATVAELASAAGLHANTVREHLRDLVAEGYVERSRGAPSGRGRPGMRYRAVVADAVSPRSDAPPDRAYVARTALTRALLDGYGHAAGDPGERARDHGRRAARSLPGPRTGSRDQLAALTDHLAELGFDPVVTDDASAVLLRSCPLLDLARERPDVVCGVHLGLAQGVLDRTPGPVRATAVEPFAAPGRCVLRLAGTCVPAS